MRPSASPTIEHKHIGDRVQYGKSTCGNGAMFQTSGTVVYDDRGSTEMTFDDGKTVSGVLNILYEAHARAGMNYQVTIDGKLIWVNGECSEFRTLAEAAKWAGV